MTRLRWRDLDGERIALIPDPGDGTARVVLRRDGEPDQLCRVTPPPEQPIRWRMLTCEHCGGKLGLAEWADGRWSVEAFEDTS